MSVWRPPSPPRRLHGAGGAPPAVHHTAPPMMPPLRLAVRLAAALALAAAPGCNLSTEACTDEIRADVSPESRTLPVGGSFAVTMRVLTCGGVRELDDTITWSTTDAAVADVGATSGVVTAIAPGTATIRGHGEDHGVTGTVQVTVVAP